MRLSHNISITVAAGILAAMSLLFPVCRGEAQTRIDLRTQSKGADIAGHLANTGAPHTAQGIAAGAKQGNGTRFQMSGAVTPAPDAIAVYDSAGNVLAGGCSIASGMLSCTDGSKLSTIELPELSVNGSDAFVLHGAGAQQTTGCIVLSGQPQEGQVLKASGTTVLDDEGRACVVMEWLVGAGGTTNLNQIPTRSFADLQNIPVVFPPAGHAGSHRNGGNDEIAVEAPAANGIPKAGASGTLSAGWLPNPGAASKGGVQARDCAATGAVGAINTDGSVTCAPVSSGALGGDLSGTAADATVARVNGVSYAAAPAVNTVPVTTGPAATTYVSLPACPDSGGNHLNYDGATQTFQCGTSSSGAAAGMRTFWSSGNTTDRGAPITYTGAGQIRIAGLYNDYPTSAANVLVYVHTADTLPCSGGANCYSVGLYDSAGRLVADTGALSMTSTGVRDLAFLEGAVTLPIGWYYLAFTGSATTARIAMSGSGSFLVPGGWNNASVSQYSTSGLLPASITIPAPGGWTTMNLVYALLH